MRPVVVSASVSMASAPADVWPLITDTDRTNRILLGKPAVYKPIEPGTQSSARFVAETTVAGFSMEYEEAPFEWTLNKSFSVYRKMRSGVLQAYTYGITLDPKQDGGTDATVRLELQPRHWLLRPVLELQARRVVQGMARLADQIDAHLRDHAPSPFLKPTSPANEDLSSLQDVYKAALSSTELIRVGVTAEMLPSYAPAACKGVMTTEVYQLAGGDSLSSSDLMDFRVK